MNPELQLFVRDSLSKGKTRKDVATVLRKAGWQDDEVKNALAAYADVDFPIPVPKRKPYLSAREAFLYLVLFLTLYISAVSFGSLVFDFINLWLPDALQGPYFNNSDSIRIGTASLVIAFPIYLWISWLLAKAIKRDPDKRGSKVRKWLTYITLFITAGVIIGDLISLVYNLLGGELTLRFILKTITVGVIAGTVFGYYLWDLRQEEKET
jgi:hypothetical protein